VRVKGGLLVLVFVVGEGRWIGERGVVGVGRVREKVGRGSAVASAASAAASSSAAGE
jgi:hypothetical protein